MSARPFVGLVLGTAIPLSLWASSWTSRGWGWFVRRALATVAGGLPFAMILGWYNHQLFGSWLEFGYTAAFGANHGLGFHVDPWGYVYGLREAIGFTSTDLLSAGTRLLETPLPLTACLGALLLAGPDLPRGAGTVLAWAFLPVLANGFYWFHEPRMLFEAAPAWILLAALGTVGVVGWSRRKGGAWHRVAQILSWGILTSLLSAAFWGVPGRWQANRWTSETLARIQVPPVPSADPPLVFVHTPWDERLTSRLQGAGGMRQDSVVLLLHRTSKCLLHEYARAREARVRGGRIDLPLPDLDLVPVAGEGGRLPGPEAGMGIVSGTRREEGLTPACEREIRADRFGTVALAPLLWQGDLPGLEGGRPLFVRDHGPEVNEAVRLEFADRPAFYFTPTAPGGPPRVIPYAEGNELLWGRRE